MVVKKDKCEIHLHVKMPKELHRRLSLYAKGKNLHVSEVIRRMVDHKINWESRTGTKKALELIATIDECAAKLKGMGSDPFENKKEKNDDGN